MAKNDFNDNAPKKFNDYTLTVSEKCFDTVKLHQLLTEWLESSGEQDKGNVLMTEVLDSRHAGFPQVRIVCTDELLQNIRYNFVGKISGTKMTQEDVGTERVIPRSGIKPPKR